jgi:hypothetical protein
MGSVDKEMPDDETSVLVAIDTGERVEVDVAFHEEGQWWHLYSQPVKRVTHWADFPSPAREWMDRVANVAACSPKPGRIPEPGPRTPRRGQTSGPSSKRITRSGTSIPSEKRGRSS